MFAMPNPFDRNYRANPTLSDHCFEDLCNLFCQIGSIHVNSKALNGTEIASL